MTFNSLRVVNGLANSVSVVWLTNGVFDCTDGGVNKCNSWLFNSVGHFTTLRTVSSPPPTAEVATDGLCVCSGVMDRRRMCPVDSCSQIKVMAFSGRLDRMSLLLFDTTYF